MSKNITIQEGGVSKQLTVDKLKTNLINSGTCLWVPEDEVQLTTKTITETGTYKASDDGYYGYEQVIVNIANVGSATGTDGDGDEAIATTTPTGELDITKLPSSIAVTTPPTITSYSDGQSINIDGMIVKAYLKTGGLWSDSDHPGGVIPNAELTINPTTASISGSRQSSEGTSSLIDYTVSFGSAPIVKQAEGSTTKSVTADGGSVACIFQAAQAERVEWIAAANSPFRASYYDLLENGEKANYREEYVSKNYTHDGKTVYYTNGGMPYGGVWGTSDLPVNGYVENLNRQAIAWTMLYGTITPEGQEDIAVYWSRPGDYKQLETSFSITVRS